MSTEVREIKSIVSRVLWERKEISVEYIHNGIVRISRPFL